MQKTAEAGIDESGRIHLPNPLVSLCTHATQLTGPYKTSTLQAMSKLVSDGEKRYTETNLPELQKIYEQRVAEIKVRHAASAQLAS